MDVLGATASIAQLAAYGKSACQQLFRLYRAVRSGPATYRDQSLNISILLSIVDRVRTQEKPQEDLILQLLVDISTLARKIHDLLGQRGVFGLNWALIIGREALSEAFTSLNGKKDLLHLHILERNQHALTQIQTDIDHMSSFEKYGPGRSVGSRNTTQDGPGNNEIKGEKKDLKGNETNSRNNMNTLAGTVSQIFRDNRFELTGL